MSVRRQGTPPYRAGPPTDTREPPAAPEDAPGRLIDRRFLVEAEIGSGSMGTIYYARDLTTGDATAIKLLQPHGAPQEVERFLRESELLAQLRHPHIVAHVAHGLTEAGRPYLAMEWLEGEDLEHHLRRRRPGIGECVELLHNASAALAAAHELGIIHRDIKPSNLFLRGGHPGDVVVLDFGIARNVLQGPALTRPGVVMGTPEYMAPEQARGEPNLGPAVDVFSLGCVIYECVTGKAPFMGEHLTAILVKVLLEEPPPPESQRPGVPPELSAVIMRMLHKDAQQRFHGGVALHEAVRGLRPPTLDDDGDGAPVRAPRSALTPHEQHYFSVAVAVHGTPGGADPMATRKVSDRPDARARTIREALAGLGVSVEVLADGALVATVPPLASASDQALLAARCGLRMRRFLPRAAIAVATGRGRLRGQMPLGEAIDRALHLLRPGEAGPALDPSDGVWIDALSANLLSGRLALVRRDGHTLLTSEEKPATGDDVRRLLGHPAPFVGREQEMAMLLSVLDTCVADSVARAVGVVASPGGGKSRLRHELIGAATRRHPELLVLLGFGDLMRVGAPYEAIGQALRGLCGVAGDESSATQRQRLRARLGLHLGPGEATEHAVAFLGEIAGVRFPDDGNRALQLARSDPKVMHDSVTDAFLEWLAAECRAAPVLLVLEDLHWGDALSVQLLERALRELAELPLLVLAFARPAVKELFPSFWSTRYIQEMPLRALSRRASEQMAQEVLRRPLGAAVDPATIARIAEQGAGHPLFLEELIRSVAEGRGDALPETVLAMLLARLSQLDAGARRVLRVASVFGETFTRVGVSALLGDDGSTAVPLALDVLARAEWIEPVRDGRAGAERYKFRHALVRDAAYSLLTDEDRVIAHRLAGAHLELLGGVDPAVLAEHAQRGQEPARAAAFFVEAAGAALSRYDPEQTQRYAAQALACGLGDPERGVVRAMQAWTCQARMDLVPGYEYAVEAVGLLRPGSFWWAKALGICFYSFFMINRFEHIDRLIGAFMAGAPDADARGAYLEAGTALCVFLTNVGARRAVANAVAKMQAVAADLPASDHGFLHLAESYRHCKLEPDLSRAIEHGRQARALVLPDSASFFVVTSLFYLGISYEAIGAVDEGEALLREGLALSLRIGEGFGAVVTRLHLGLLLAGKGDADALVEAERIGGAYLDNAEMGPSMQGLCHHILGLVQWRRGDLEGAAASLSAALADFSALPPSRLLVKPALIEVLLQLGRVDEAHAYAEEGLRLLEAQGGLGHCDVPLRLAVVLARRAAGDHEAARLALDDAQRELAERAARIDDPALRAAYLARAENQRIVALAGEAARDAAG